MGKESQFVITFEGIPVADANKLAADLETELKMAGVEVSRQRQDESSMDFGASLVLILGTPAVVMAARALYAWVKRKNAGSLRIKLPNGSEFSADNIESKDAPALAEALAKSMASA